MRMETAFNESQVNDDGPTSLIIHSNPVSGGRVGHVIPLQVHHFVLFVQLCRGQDKSQVEGKIGACSTVGDTPGLTLITL